MEMKPDEIPLLPVAKLQVFIGADSSITVVATSDCLPLMI